MPSEGLVPTAPHRCLQKGWFLLLLIDAIRRVGSNFAGMPSEGLLRESFGRVGSPLMLWLVLFSSNVGSYDALERVGTNFVPQRCLHKVWFPL